MKLKLRTKIVLSLVFVVLFTHSVSASETDGTIVTGGNAGFAWSNNAGWVNFGVPTGNIHIADNGITGHAWSTNYGWINMAPTNGGVTIAASGGLSGYAWGASLGWINFSGVSINSSGRFVGQATGGIIGTLTFDCDNCNVATDYRPQNFRAAPSGGEGGPGGPAGPMYIYVSNGPMKLLPHQAGTLTQNLTDNKIVRLEVPHSVSIREITFIISEEKVSPDAVPPAISIIGNAFFDVTAWDGAGNQIHSLLKPVKIMLTIPGLLRGRSADAEALADKSDLGVYFFDEEAGVWIKITDAVFSGDTASFYVDHLTLFAIFGGTELPPILGFPVPLLPEAPPSKAPPAGPPTGEFPPGEPSPRAPVTPETPTEIPPPEEPEITGEEQPLVLFDLLIRPALEKVSRNPIFIAVFVLPVPLAMLFYFFYRKFHRARLKRKQ